MKTPMTIDELREKGKEIHDTVEALTEEINRWLMLILLEDSSIDKATIFCFRKPGSNDIYNVEIHWPHPTLDKKMGYHWFSEATIKAVIKNFRTIGYDIKNRWKFCRSWWGSFEMALWEKKNT